MLTHALLFFGIHVVLPVITLTSNHQDTDGDFVTRSDITIPAGSIQGVGQANETQEGDFVVANVFRYSSTSHPHDWARKRKTTTVTSSDNTKSKVPEPLSVWAERVINSQLTVRVGEKKQHYNQVVFDQDIKPEFVFLLVISTGGYLQKDFFNWLKTFPVELRKNIRRAISFTVCIHQNAISKVQWLQKTGQPV